MMKKLVAIGAGILIFFLTWPAWAFDWNSIKPQYAGIGFNYAQEANLVFKHSDRVDYESGHLRLFFGRHLAGRWRAEGEVVLADVREYSQTEKQHGTVYGWHLAVLYDIFRSERLTIYAGLAGGLAYFHTASDYEDIGDRSPFGLIEGRLGAEVKVDKHFFMRAQAGCWHLSSVFRGDTGHNSWIYGLQFGYYF
ncbi:MAG: hypothetical protein MUC28_03915 [Planctomycetes bacterium]|jgi:hypothetical protein|nr:hypothetical protein [Planctomycetota bacterium]